MTTDEQFGIFLQWAKHVGAVEDFEELSQQFALYNETEKISFLDSLSQVDNSFEGAMEAIDTMPGFSMSTVKRFIDENEPSGVYQNLDDFFHHDSPQTRIVRQFALGLNLIKHDYIKRSKFVDNMVDAATGYHSFLIERYTADGFSESAMVSKSRKTLENLTEMKRRNAQDLLEIMRFKTGAVDKPDEIDEPRGKI